MDTFKTTRESQKAMEDLVLASDVKTALLELKPDIQVIVRDGVVTIGASDTIVKNPDLVLEMEKIVRAIPGVKEVGIKSSHLVELSD
jgi:osmotically-inducible protein OsmY